MKNTTATVLTNHSQSAPAIKALKEKIKLLFRQNEVLHKRVLVYDTMVERLNHLEKVNPEKRLKFNY